MSFSLFVQIWNRLLRLLDSPWKYEGAAADLIDEKILGTGKGEGWWGLTENVCSYPDRLRYCA